jgi:hypothetical protein
MINQGTIDATRDILYGLATDADVAITVETYKEAQTKLYVASVQITTPTSSLSMTERASSVTQAAGELWHKLGMIQMNQGTTTA